MGTAHMPMVISKRCSWEHVVLYYIGFCRVPITIGETGSFRILHSFAAPFQYAAQQLTT